MLLCVPCRPAQELHLSVLRKRLQHLELWPLHGYYNALGDVLDADSRLLLRTAGDRKVYVSARSDCRAEGIAEGHASTMSTALTALARRNGEVKQQLVHVRQAAVDILSQHAGKRRLG